MKQLSDLERIDDGEELVLDTVNNDFCRSTVRMGCHCASIGE